ncbi:MAG: DUF2721 domain-containing protein [Bacteroidota bacterium]
MEASQDFIMFLQSTLTPVALISGVGLLLLTITNRLGRTIDRTRYLVAELDNPNAQRQKEKEYEIAILYKRSTYLRNSIAFIVISVIASSLIIPVLFFMNLFEMDLKIIGYFLFILSILSILVSSIFFFMDVVVSLNALKLEAKERL